MKMRHFNNTGARFAISLIVLATVLTFCAAGILMQSDSAYAITDTSATVTVGELLLSDYDTRTDGLKFNGEMLVDLFGYLNSGSGHARVSDVASKGTMTAQQIRDKIAGDKDIVVKFGDMDWTVAYVTQDNSGNTIATLWLASSSESSLWNLWNADAPTLAYPSNMYSSSYIRANALNTGSGYVATKGATTLTPVAQSASHAYAKFTMSGIAGSLIDYIVQPQDVAYQENESVRMFSTVMNTAPNEAYGTPVSESYSPNLNYASKTGYTDWKSDYLWLPSYAETGARNNNVTGIWELSDNQRRNGAKTWLRTGFYNNAWGAFCLHSSGTIISNEYATPSTVRPAMHLNLTKAAQDATDAIDVPTLSASDQKKAYQAAVQTFALQHYDESKIDVAVSCKDPAGKEIAASEIAFDKSTGAISAKYAGTYTVELSLKRPTVSFWMSGDDSTGKRSLTFTITPKQLTLALSNDVPDGKWEWTLGGAYKASLTASGIEAGDTVGLHAAYTEDTSGAKQEVAATQDGAQTVATIDLSQIAIGTYKLTAVLDNSVGESINYSIRNGLNTAGIPRAFTVLSKKIDTSNIAWQYTVLGPSGNPLPNATDLEIANGRQIVFAYFGTLDSYGAVTNKLEINRSTLPTDNQDNLLVEIDNLTSSFNGTTYTDGYSNPSGSAVAHYTTKVLLKIVHDDYLFDNNKKQIELTIDWEIVKGTFDLSGVKWKYKYTTDTGIVTDYYDPNATVLEYNDGGRISVSVDAATLPLGLEAPDGGFDYNNGESGTRVQKYTTTLAGNSLEYDAGCFEQPADLVLEWEIVGKGIEVKWKRVAAGAYFLRELNCDPKYKEIVHYRYYDAAGNELGADEAGRQAIADKVAAENIGPENPQNFKIVAYLDGTGSENYRLKTDPAETIVKIGNDAITTIKAEMPQSVEYDGNAKYTQDDIQFTGAPI